MHLHPAICSRYSQSLAQNDIIRLVYSTSPLRIFNASTRVYTRSITSSTSSSPPTSASTSPSETTTRITQKPNSKPNLKPHQFPPRPTLPTQDLHHTYLKGSGPGGQKINKTNSAVQLTHIPTGIVVKSQATRSRSQNHNIARRILAEKVDELTHGDESRGAKVREVKKRKKASGEKKRRRKYRRLHEGEREVGNDGIDGNKDTGQEN